MNLINFISFIFIIITCVNNTIIEEDHNDSMSLGNDTDDYRSWNVSMRYVRQITDSDPRCKIPNYSNSTYKVISGFEAIIYKPEDYVNHFSVLKIICDKGYNLPPLTPSNFSCYNGNWDQPPPACIRTCSSLRSTTSTTVQCKYKDETILLDNCILPIDGTSVHLSCNAFYESDDIRKNQIRFCTQGEWSPEITQCSAICGLKSPKAKFNIINGNDSTPGDYPWHVGIYNKEKEYLCGGSIIDQRIILSAAHCFTYHHDMPPQVENYLIAAGKFYSQYEDSRDAAAQYSKVHQIIIPEKYIGIEGLTSYDIAIVILEEPFTLTTSVLPVCIDFNAVYDNADYLLNNYGIVTGWGLTQEDSAQPSAVLKEIRIPYISFDKCHQAVPSQFKSYVTAYDKICGGFLNQGTSVCVGDSGGALVDFKNGNYYVIGIVSTSPVSESNTAQCNSQQYSLYTAVNAHITFIRKEISYHRWMQPITCPPEKCTNKETEKRDGCLLPNFPEHGNFSLSDQNHKYQSGNYVETNSAILLTCENGYIVNSSSSAFFFSCTENGTWYPALGSCAPIAIINSPTNSTILVNPNYADLADGLFHKFDLQLLEMHNNEENFVVSPAEIKIMLAMLLEGSNGKSSEEINKVVHSKEHGFSKRIDDALYALSAKSRNTVLNVGNIFALSNKYTMRQEFINILHKYNYAQTENVDFSKSVQFASYLNNWVKSATHGIINKIISAENIPIDTSLIITSALFLKAHWKFAFTVNVNKFTYIDKFKKTTRRYVKTLNVEGIFRYKFFKNLDAEIVELPCSDEQHAMAIFLPTTVQTDAGLQKILLLEYFRFNSVIDRLTLTDLKITMPKFDIEYSPNIKAIFQRVGIKEIFSENADLSGIVEQREAKINDIFHKVNVEMNENGLSSATIGIRDPKSVIVNRPFLFFIYKTSTKDILFEGRLNSPTPL